MISDSREKIPHKDPPNKSSVTRKARSRRIEKARAGSAKGNAKKGQSKKVKKERTPTVVDVLILLGKQNADLFHDAGKVAYATIGVATYKLRSRLFRSWLASRYFAHTQGRAANNEAMGCAVNSLEALAIHDAPERAVYVRLAECGGRVFLNLADDAGTVIRIDRTGWCVDPSPPVRFLATANSASLPMPEQGGMIEELRRHINCPDDDSFALLCGWISACFRADGPFPLLVLSGQQGSAKSTTGRILKLLIDPEQVKDRSAPRDLRDLAIWAAGSRLLCVDNISHFPDWLSDGFCRLATGGGFGTRTLYENEEETIFDAKRPTIMNGIEDFVKRPDLLERSIILWHPPIPENERWLESKLWREFNAAKPKLLGAILDRVSAGLKALPNVDTSRMPRMADAAAFAVACETGMKEQARFLEAFRQNQADSHELTLADSPIAEPIRKFVVDKGGTWTGSATDLYAATKPPGEKLPHGWPKQPSGLTGMLRRLAPALAKCYGLTVNSERESNAKRSRVIQLVIDTDISQNNAPGASNASENAKPPPDDWTTPDDQDDVSRKFSGTDISALFR